MSSHCSNPIASGGSPTLVDLARRSSGSGARMPGALAFIQVGRCGDRRVEDRGADQVIEATVEPLSG
jgi:hypothetical protein